MKGPNGSCFIAGSFCKDVDDKTCTMIHAAYSFGNLPDENKKKRMDKVSPYVLCVDELLYNYFFSHSHGWVEYRKEDGRTKLECLEFQEDRDGVFRFCRDDEEVVLKFKEEYYNKCYGNPGWRVWSSEPSEQHRKQVEWED